MIATESPVRIWDYERGVIEEVLVSGGMRTSAKVPLLNAHNRYDAENVIGSVRDIKVDGSNVSARILFSDEGDGTLPDRLFKKAAQGHLTDVSVGYSVREYEDIEPGESASVGGRSFTASDYPLRVSTQWELREVSLVPIGADAQAKFRAAQHAPKKEGSEMEEQKEVARTEPAPKDQATVAPPDPKEIERAASEKATEAVRAERERIMSIRKAAGNDIPTALVDECIGEGLTVEQASVRFLESLRKSRPEATKPDIGVGETGEEKLERAYTDSVLLRHGLPVAPERKAEAEALTRHGIKDMARQMVKDGNRLNDEDLFKRAIATGSFTNLLSNVGTKLLHASYQEYPSTALLWASTVELANFKTYNDLKLSAFGTLPQVGDGGELDMSTLSEAKETIRLKTHGINFALTRQTWINDDLDAFVRIPSEMGMAAKRNIDTQVYYLLAGVNVLGPTMGEDGKRLFATDHASGANYWASATTSLLDDTGLALAKTYLRKMKGLAGEPLNITPRVLLVPPELEHNARKMINSTEIHISAAGGTDAQYLQATANVHRGMATVVVEPRLSGYAPKAWYLVGDPAMAKSVVVGFLRGQQSPTIERNDPVNVLGIGWRIYHDVGVAALDYRGIVRAKGEV